MSNSQSQSPQAQAQAQALSLEQQTLVIQGLEQQRNMANNQVVLLQMENSLLQKKVQELSEYIQAKIKPQSTPQT